MTVPHNLSTSSEIEAPRVEDIKVEPSQTGVRFTLTGEGEFRTTAKMFHVLRDAFAAFYEQQGASRLLLIGYASRRDDEVQVLRDPQYREFFYDSLESFRSGVQFINQYRFIVLNRGFTESTYFRTRPKADHARKGNGGGSRANSAPAGSGGSHESGRAAPEANAHTGEGEQPSS